MIMALLLENCVTASQVFLFFAVLRGDTAFVLRHGHGRGVFGVADVTVLRRVPNGIDEQRVRGQRHQVPFVELLEPFRAENAINIPLVILQMGSREGHGLYIEQPVTINRTAVRPSLSHPPSQDAYKYNAHLKPSAT